MPVAGCRFLHPYTIGDIPWCNHGAEPQECRSRTPGRRIGPAHRRVQTRNHPPRARGTQAAAEKRLGRDATGAGAGLPGKARVADIAKTAARQAADAGARRRNPRLRTRRRMTIDSSALIAIVFSEPGYL